MTYKIYLTDSAGVHELPPLNVPLSRVKIEGMKERIPLSGNVYDQYIFTKRIWTHTWAYMTKDEYDLLDEILERQKSERKYPRLTIDGENVTDLVVKYTLSSKELIDSCGTVENVTITVRETRQLGT